MKNTCFDASLASKQCVHTALVNHLQKGSMQWSILQTREMLTKLALAGFAIYYIVLKNAECAYSMIVNNH